MIKRCIYATEDFNIVKVKLEINEKILNKLLCQINEFYKTRVELGKNTNKKENEENLYTILNDILKCKNNLRLSYLVCDLLNYECSSEEENKFLNQSLLCFHFSLVKGFLDFRKMILNCEYKIDLNAADPYYIDENTISKDIDDLPFIKTK